MPSNIDTIERTCELPRGTFLMYQAKDDNDAIYYANGRRSYLYRSKIIKAIYLFVPVRDESVNN